MTNNSDYTIYIHWHSIDGLLIAVSAVFANRWQSFYELQCDQHVQ